jgi:transcriptional regulator with XRE-family HTH domain
VPRTASSSLANQLLGQALRTARKQAGQKQAEVADELGVTQAYICNLEAGRMNLTIGQLYKIADAIGVQVEISFKPVPDEEDFELPDEVLPAALV